MSACGSVAHAPPASPQLCWNATNGACPEALARRPLRDFADDGSGAAERVYRHGPLLRCCAVRRAL